MEQHEKELLTGRGERALVAAAGLARARLPVVGAAGAPFLPSGLEGIEQPLELPCVKAGQGAQQPRLAENNVHLHVHQPTKMGSRLPISNKALWIEWFFLRQRSSI